MNVLLDGTLSTMDLNGWISWSQSSYTQYTCMDESLQQIPGSGGDTNGKIFDLF